MFRLTDVFLGQSPRATEIKPKINQRDLIKQTSFYPAKETIKKKKPKRQPTEWEKIVSNNASDKGLISKNIQMTYTTQQQKKPTTQLKHRQET